MRRRSRAGSASVKSRRRKAATPKRRSAPAVRAESESARLRRERDEALEREKATAEVLRVISSSAGQLEPIFQAMLENAVRICGANFGVLFLREGDAFRRMAMHNPPPAYVEEHRRAPVVRPSAASAHGRLVATKRVLHIADLRADQAYRDGVPTTVRLVEAAGARSYLGVPMLKDHELIGTIIIYRQEVRPFTDKQIALVQNFADQAVIAIENARLLNELRQSLEQQTATAEVLKVISSSPGDVQPVLASVAENAARICEAQFASIVIVENDALRVAMRLGEVGWPVGEQIPLDRSTIAGRSIIDMRPIQVADLQQAGNEFALGRQYASEIGSHTVLSVPLIREGRALGSITILRTEVRPFEQKHIALLSTFADQAAIAIENVRLFEAEQQRTRELTESLEQQTATSEVLRVISSSPGELEPVFEAMLDNAVQICHANFGNLWLREGNSFRIVATKGASREYRETLFSEPVVEPHPQSAMGRIALSKEVVQIDDMSNAPTYGQRMRIATIQLAKARTLVGVPMLKDDQVIGIIAIYRQEVRSFTQKQIELVQNFAAQAVIAIENTRLLNELRQRTTDLTESLEQQTATSEVLSVISSSPGELGAVFDAVLVNATRLCEAKFGILLLWERDAFRTVALHNVPPALVEHRRREPLIHPAPVTALGRLVATKQVDHVADMRAEKAYVDGHPGPVSLVELAGARTVINVPMLKERELIGCIAIYRQEVRPFTDKQIALLQNFAAQAVIAIENARLLSELRQRTDDLTESLEQQTATSEVLRVISTSPGELDSVFQTILENATRLCTAEFGFLWRVEDGNAKIVAKRGIPLALAEYLQRGPHRPPLNRLSPLTAIGRVVQSRQTVHIADYRVDQSYLDRDPATVAAIELGVARTLLIVPMLKDNELIGAIGIYRQEVRPFTEKQITLVTNFAAQAVIAVENARLLNELRQRTTDLTESLEQQTATSDVLQIISSSPGDLEPVFQAMLTNATRICEAAFGNLYLCEADAFRLVATHHDSPAYVAARTRDPLLRPPPDAPLGRLAITKQVVQIADIRTLPSRDHPFVAPGVRAGYRTVLSIPLLKDDELIGAFSMIRQEVRPFTDKQIALLTNFARQAVIAIENTRLLNELRQSLDQQTATADVLRIISSSPGQLEPVFQAMLENAIRICEAKHGHMLLKDGNLFRVAAAVDTPSELADFFKRRGPFEPTPGSHLDESFGQGG